MPADQAAGQLPDDRPGGEWAVDSGTGRAVTREEMLALLDQADRDGLVLEPENTKSPMFVCCCCGCCCGVLESAKRLPRPADFFSTNFYAAADEEVCESCGMSCGMCETRCQMDAITSPEGKAVVDRARCIGCALCVSTCPSGALRLEAVRTSEGAAGRYQGAVSENVRGPVRASGAWRSSGIRRMLGMKI